MSANQVSNGQAPMTVVQRDMAKVEQVMINGDLSRLDARERVFYYKQVCESLGLNPLTKPFDYITLNGKLTLYARKDATEQLRQIRGVSIHSVTKEVIDDVYVVTASARDKSGREDTATGAVSVAGLKGENKANAMMKAETKAKRRVTLSICGLGMLDETEVDDIPASAKGTVVPEQPGPNDGIQTEGYHCPGHLDHRIANKPISKCDPAVLRDVVLKLEDKYQKLGKPIPPKGQEFIAQAEPFIAGWENTDPDDFESAED